ncbi:Crp/Fnr family transcriptional regulator [Sphingomonas sp. RB3P16]|uniref:Crp/Fnr family transcriptional regulator n=1 Tax=Parasphingomonas frigoris TaxID=3096163 RepID=UPI002FCAD01B
MPVTLQPLLNKLKRRSSLEAEDELALMGLPFTTKVLEPSRYLVRQGDKASFGCVLLQGFAYRQKVVGDGGRQIVALQVPGDAIDMQNSLLKIADHSVQALSTIMVARIPFQALLDLAALRPAIAQAFWMDTFVDSSIAWEWMANIGRRNALMRVAHLLCEIALRLEAVTFCGGELDTPAMTQEQMSDALGLTPVHVNRMLKKLENLNLIDRKSRAVSIIKMAKLREFADFQETYLHLDMVNN